MDSTTTSNKPFSRDSYLAQVVEFIRGNRVYVIDSSLEYGSITSVRPQILIIMDECGELDQIGLYQTGSMALDGYGKTPEEKDFIRAMAEKTNPGVYIPIVVFFDLELVAMLVFRPLAAEDNQLVEVIDWTNPPVDDLSAYLAEVDDDLTVFRDTFCGIRPVMDRYRTGYGPGVFSYMCGSDASMLAYHLKDHLIRMLALLAVENPEEQGSAITNAASDGTYVIMVVPMQAQRPIVFYTIKSTPEGAVTQHLPIRAIPVISA
ncbi:hypothetical protein HGA91_04085 [candidate division WWE3 bacterium]|nr:hypothetical protein [candidate division WWE3 bacterium]